MAAERPGGTPRDLELVERAQQGDLTAFDRLVTARLDDAYRLAKAITGDHSEAQAAVQAAFVDAWRALPGLASADDFDPSFGRIIVKAAQSSPGWGRAVRSPRRPAEDRPRTRSEVIAEAIDRLPADQRTALALATFERLDEAEIADVMDAGVPSVRRLLEAARSAIDAAVAR